MKTIKMFFVSLTIVACAISSYQGIALAAKVTGVDMQYVSKGVDLAVQGKFNEAKEEFEKALKIEPSNDTTKRALKIIENLDDKKIESKTAIFLFKGLAFFMNGSWDKAIAEYNKAIEINPKIKMAYYLRGNAHSKKGRHDQAISDFSKAIEIDPKDANAYYNRGNAYLVKHRYDLAVSDFSKAIEINPKLTSAYNNRAITYYSKKEYDKAWDDVNQAQSLGSQIHPGFLKALREASGRQQ